MMGAHERVGAGSAILKLRGIHLIFETMRNYVKDPTLNQRIKNLSKQISYLLQEVQTCNPLIIKGLVDRRYLIDPEEDQNVVNSDDEFEDPFEDNNYDPNDASTPGWNKSTREPDFAGVLRRHLIRKKISIHERGHICKKQCYLAPLCCSGTLFRQMCPLSCIAG